jgi:hypothetical protein
MLISNKEMSNQRREIIEIKEYIKKWIYDIELSNSLYYFDINKISEGVSLRLLNLVYELDLKDLNEEKANFPGIDLGNDVSSKIAFQITSDNSSKKIKGTLKTFKESGFDKKFTKGVKFLILRTRKKRFSKIEGYDDIFDASKDILYVSDLIREIEILFWDDNERFLRIKNFLSIEFGNHNTEKTLLFPHNGEKIKNFIAVTKANLPSPDKIVYLFRGEDQKLYDAVKLFDQSFENGGKIILGRSGCGKSLLAKAWVLKYCGEMAPLVLEAKYFETGLIKMIDDEVVKYGFKSSSDFILICREAQKKIIIVLDGLNECDLSQSEILLSQLAELSAQQNVLFIVTAQELSQSMQNLEVEVVRMSMPDLELRKAIAAIYSDFTDKLVPVLTNVSTALEAKMVGEIGIFDADRISRFSLFELYLRKKLDRFETQAMLLLSLIGYWMSRAISFSISLRQVNILMQENNIPDAVFVHCIREHILVKDFTKVSFEHEMILNFFTADAVVRFNKEGEKVVQEFNAPRNDDKKLLIIGSLNDDPVLRNYVLESITDYQLLLEIFSGEAGDYCRIWAEQMLASILEKMRFEADNISFSIVSNSDVSVIVDPDSLSKWTKTEISFFQVLGYKLTQGQLLKEIFTVIETIDTRRNEFYTLLLSEAKDKKINLRNELFSAVYTALGYMTDMTGIAYLLNFFSSGFYTFNSKTTISDAQIKEMIYPKITFGQLYFLLKLYRSSDNFRILYPVVRSALKTTWKSLPYHLKIEVLFIVPFCTANEEQRLEMIEILNKIHSETENIWLSTAVFDALGDLDALEEDAQAHKENVSRQISGLLAEPEKEESWSEAYYIYNAQFDHPYNTAYYETLQELTELSKKTFFKMAVRHKADHMFFGSGLIFACEKVLREECCQFLNHYLVDPFNSTETQFDTIQTSLAALVVLARYNWEIPSLDFLYKDDQIIKNHLALATILVYWINRTDLTEQEIRKKCISILRQLLNSEPLFFVHVFKQVESSFLQVQFPIRFYDKTHVKSMKDFFSGELLAACRTALVLPVPNMSFRFERAEDVQRYAVDNIGIYGGACDISELHKAAGHSIFGKNAVAALKMIKERL